MLTTISARVRTPKGDALDQIFGDAAEAHDAILRSTDAWSGRTHDFRDLYFFVPPDLAAALTAYLERQQGVVEVGPADDVPDGITLFDRRKGVDRRTRPRAQAGDRRRS